MRALLILAAIVAMVVGASGLYALSELQGRERGVSVEGGVLELSSATGGSLSDRLISGLPAPSGGALLPHDPGVLFPTYTPAPLPVVPPPAPTAAPARVSPQVDGDMMAHAELVCEAFPEARQMCEHVVWAESLWGDWRCHVYGPCWSPTSDCGLLQINIIHAGKFAAHGWNIYVDCFDPAKNLVIAREIFNQQGIGAWTTAR